MFLIYYPLLFPEEYIWISYSLLQTVTWKPHSGVKFNTRPNSCVIAISWHGRERESYVRKRENKIEDEGEGGWYWKPSRKWKQENPHYERKQKFHCNDISFVRDNNNRTKASFNLNKERWGGWIYTTTWSKLRRDTTYLW